MNDEWEQGRQSSFEGKFLRSGFGDIINYCEHKLGKIQRRTNFQNSWKIRRNPLL
jgi:hypothetical protein